MAVQEVLDRLGHNLSLFKVASTFLNIHGVHLNCGGRPWRSASSVTTTYTVRSFCPLMRTCGINAFHAASSSAGIRLLISAVRITVFLEHVIV